MKILTNKRNYFITILYSFGAMFLTMIVGIISIPISLNYWRPEKFGMWALISTMITYLSVSNLGLNSTASTLICKNNSFNIKMIALKKTTKLLLISVTIFLIAFIILNTTSKNWIFIIGIIPENLINETYYAIVWSTVLFVINVPLSNISSALNGFQRMYVDKLFSIISTILGFLMLIITIHFHGSLVMFSILTGFNSITINIIKIIYFYYEIYIKERLKNYDTGSDISYSDETSYKNIIITSMRFFSIGIATMVVWNTDNLVISHLLSVKDVTPYAITFKLYCFIFSIIAIVNGSMMPLFGKEIGNDNWQWLNKVYSTMLVIIAVMGGLTWLGGILFLKDIIYLWAGKEAYAGLLTVFSLGGYSYLLCIVNLNSGILSALNYISKTVYIGWLEAIINITLSIVFVKYFGIGGAALGTFIGSLLSVFWLLPIVIVKETNNRLNINKTFLFKHLFFIIMPLIFIAMLIQIFVNNMLLRVFAGCIVVIVYLIVSYIMVPKYVKQYILNIAMRPLVIKISNKMSTLKRILYSYLRK